jgi:hypothetical protein
VGSQQSRLPLSSRVDHSRSSAVMQLTFLLQIFGLPSFLRIGTALFVYLNRLVTSDLYTPNGLTYCGHQWV